MGCFLSTLVYGSCSVVHSGKQTRVSSARIFRRFRESTIDLTLESLV